MNRPVILVDLDNVVYDWAKSMAIWLIENGLTLPSHELQIYNPVDGGLEASFPAPPVEAAMRHYKSWQVWEDWGIPKGEFIRWWRLGIEAGEIYGKGPLIPGARHALWAISDAEWDIHIATSRLTKFGLHDRILENTASWLRDNNIPYRNVHFTDSKRAITAAAIVDDRADNMGENHGTHYHFPANHNQGRFVTAKEQIEAWEGIVDTLTEKSITDL